MRAVEKLTIENDLFDISGALRSVDPGYFILYDKLRGRFEVHNSAQAGGTYCLTLPYPVLDRRAAVYVRRSRSERGEAFLAELERENGRRESERAYEAKRRALNGLGL